MTKFSFEVPIKYMERFHDLQDYYFTLSILYENKQYARFIRDIRSEGLHTIWLDNSYNETMEADRASHLIDLYTQFDCDRVISPDSPSWRDVEIAQAYYEVSTRIPGQRIICVVSSPSMLQYMIDNTGASTFAVSYWVRPKLSDYELSEMRSCHFLGLLSVPEILKYRPPSCDTSMPIKLALKGLTLRDWANSGYEHINTKDLGDKGSHFFYTEMTNQAIELARDNIKRLKEVCNG